MTSLLFAVVFAAASPLAELEHLYTESRYPEALAVADALVSNEKTSPADRLAARLIAGYCHVVLGNTDAARAHFRAVLRADPTRRLPATVSPKLSRMFEEERAALAKEPGMIAEEPVIAKLGPRTFAFRFRLANAANLRAFVAWRSSRDGAYAESELVADGPLHVGRFTLEPKIAAGTLGVEWFAELRDGASAVVALQSRDRPGKELLQVEALDEPVLQVTAQRRGPPWWVWLVSGVAIAVTAVGVTLAAYFLTRPTTGGIDVGLAAR